MEPAEWIGPLLPELTAESLAASVLIGEPALTRALVAPLPAHRVDRILRVVAREMDSILLQGASR
jgi:hypothetical protein